MKNYLLTGSTGFVGRNIAKNLLKNDVSLSVVVRKKNKHKLNEFPSLKNVFYTDNLFLESKDWWKEVCQNIDVVIHAAWYTQHDDYLDSLFNLECLSGSLNLSLGAIEANIRKFIGIGTCFEYAPSIDPLTVESSLGPFTLYGAAKTSLYLTLTKLFKNNSIPFAWARLFYLHGEGEDPNKLTSVIRRKLELNKKIEILSGEEIRDYLDVKIAGRMIATLALSEQVGAVNICSGLPVSIKELSLNIASEQGKKHLIDILASNNEKTNTSKIVGVPNIVS
jgi:dTDP-6-deoxy-L-talose 4-dehydrogenase (NAD+)